MIFTLADVISPEEYVTLLELARTATFVDGRETAGKRLSSVKYNEQLAQTCPAMTQIESIVTGALQRNARFQLGALPRYVHSIRVARYRVGMCYGPHVDAALMHFTDGPLRADLSFTLFLADPSTYDGGDLCLDTGSGELPCKLRQRCLVCYPTGQLHQVREVTRGERLVIVGWVQSCVRGAEERETLWDLTVANELVHEAIGKTRAYDLLVKTRANLLRRWADT